MTTIAAAMNRAARQCSVTPPSAWVTSTDPTIVELKDYLDETVGDILDRCDLPSPIGAEYDIPADGSETYGLPEGFRRLMRDPHAVFEKSNQRRPLTPVSRDGEWTHLKEIGSTGAERFYRMTGYEGNYSISIFQEPDASVEIVVAYVTENWKATAAGEVGSIWGAEDDVLLLPRKVVEAGVIWRFRERKGLPYQARYTDYEAQLGRLMNDRRTRRIIDLGGASHWRKPWDVPVPDFIPES